MCFLRIASFLLRTEMTGDRNQFWNNLVMTGDRAFSFSCLVGKAHHVESFAELGIVAA